MHAGAGVALANRTDDLQLAGLETVGEGHAVLVAITLDGHLDPGRQRVDHRDTDAVQATGKLVVLVRELAAGMQLGEDQFDARNALLRVDVHRHATTIVDHLQRVVLVQDHLHGAGVTRQGLVDTVVDDFLREVVGPRGIGVHTRTLADRVQARQDFNGFGGIRHKRLVMSL